METMLAKRSFQGEIIAFYSDQHFLSMAVNVLLNIQERGFAHYIIIMNNEDQCSTLVKVGEGAVDSCAWMSGPTENDPQDIFFKPSKEGVPIELGTRHYFMWRFLQHGINVLWMDTDVHVPRNPYPYFKTTLQHVNLLMKDHVRVRQELNTGLMYAQNVTKDGPVATAFKETFVRWKTAHRNVPVKNSKGADVTRAAVYEQQIMTDVILGLIGHCKATYRLTHSEDDYNHEDLQTFSSAFTTFEPLKMCGAEEWFKISGPLEFGWKEQAYSLYNDLYSTLASLKAPATRADIDRVMNRSMPLIVHVRDQGGHFWEKDWRLAQLGWWDNRIDNIGDLSMLLQQVINDGGGKVLQLQGVTEEAVPTPEAYLNLVEWFLHLAVLARRVPVLPPIPCSLTTQNWPTKCPPGQETSDHGNGIRWFVNFADEHAAPEDVLSTFHCALNEKQVCRLDSGLFNNGEVGEWVLVPDPDAQTGFKWNFTTSKQAKQELKYLCLGSRYHLADIHSFVLKSDMWKQRFPRDPVVAALNGGGVEKNVSMTSAAYLEAMSLVAGEDNVALDVADLPARIEQLSPEDDKNLLGCSNNYEAVENLSDCITLGRDSPKCKKMEDMEKFPRPNSTSVAFHNVYHVEDHSDNAKKKSDIQLPAKD